MDGFHQQDTFSVNDDVPPNNSTKNHQPDNGVSNGAQSSVNGSKSNYVR